MEVKQSAEVEWTSALAKERVAVRQWNKLGINATSGEGVGEGVEKLDHDHRPRHLRHLISQALSIVSKRSLSMHRSNLMEIYCFREIPTG